MYYSLCILPLFKIYMQYYWRRTVYTAIYISHHWIIGTLLMNTKIDECYWTHFVHIYEFYESYLLPKDRIEHEILNKTSEYIDQYRKVSTKTYHIYLNFRHENPKKRTFSMSIDRWEISKQFMRIVTNS